jgi:polar amino acid transport system substrate-binding protein
VAATTGDCPPWNSVAEDGSLTGMEVEMVEEICELINCTVTWRTVSFDGLIPGLIGGDFDVAVSNMTHTRAREEQVDFTEHYYRSGEVVVVRADETLVNDYRDLGTLDIPVGSETGTICEVAARQIARVPDERLQLYEGLDTLFLALVNGDIDAVVDGAESAARYVEQYPDELKIVGEGEYRLFGGGPVGMAVNKNEPSIRDAFTAAIIAMREDGAINELLEKYDQQVLAPEDYRIEIPEGR